MIILGYLRFDQAERRIRLDKGFYHSTSDSLGQVYFQIYQIFFYKYKKVPLGARCLIPNLIEPPFQTFPFFLIRYSFNVRLT